MNNSGPNREPLGTPLVIEHVVYFALLTRTYCLRKVKYEAMSSRSSPPKFFLEIFSVEINVGRNRSPDKAQFCFGRFVLHSLSTLDVIMQEDE